MSNLEKQIVDFKNEEEWNGFNNPYHNPEKCGLKIIEVVEEPDIAFDFDMVVLWQGLVDKRFYWLRDRGCSCPAPYENVKSLHDLNEGLDGYEAEKIRVLEGR